MKRGRFACGSFFVVNLFLKLIKHLYKCFSQGKKYLMKGMASYVKFF